MGGGTGKLRKFRTGNCLTGSRKRIVLRLGLIFPSDVKGGTREKTLVPWRADSVFLNWTRKRAGN